MRKIIFGIRKSRLARTQLDEFAAYLAQKKIKMDCDVKTISTAGDRDRVTPVEEMGSGIFTKEIERALLKKEIDCAVHSLKDMPVAIEAGTVISCYVTRADVRDCLITGEKISINNLLSLRIGTGSTRRLAFIREIEPGVRPVPLRGNVDTRVRKMDEGGYDAMVLAACGLKRLGYENRIKRYFDPDTFVPPAGQGIICSQTRADDEELNSILAACSSQDTAQAALAERKVLEALGIGCTMPFGVYARLDDDKFTITAKMYSDESRTYMYERRMSSRAGRENATADLISAMKTKMGKA